MAQRQAERGRRVLLIDLDQDDKAPPAEDQPRYQRLLRKEARLRYDQATALTELRRRLSRGRTDRSEVITDNTMIRVAVDLLLAHADELSGDTEDALRASVLPQGRGC